MYNVSAILDRLNILFARYWSNVKLGVPVKVHTLQWRVEHYREFTSYSASFFLQNSLD